MDQDDIRKIAAKLGCPEKDVSLALQTAKEDIGDAEKLLAKTIHVVKGCYAAKTNRLNGGFVMVFDAAQKKILRVKALATYDSAFGDIPLNQPWEQIEKKVFDAEVTQNFVPAISHDLQGEMEFTLQDSISDALGLLAAQSSDDIGSRIRRIVCTCLGDSDVQVNCAIETISPLKLKIIDQEIKSEVEPPAAGAAPADGATPSAGAAGIPGMVGEDRNLVLKTDIILSPVAGIPVTTLNPGDYIMVKITDTRPQASYIANLLHAVDKNRAIPVRVPIRKIDRSESNRLIITTEFGPGVFGRTVVQEGLKIKATAEEAAPLDASSKLPSSQAFLIIIVAAFVLFLLMVVVYYFVSVL